MMLKATRIKLVQTQVLTMIALVVPFFIVTLMVLGVSFMSSMYVALSLLLQIMGGGTLWLLASRSRSVHIAEVLGVGLALGSIIATLSAQALLPFKIGIFGFQLPGLLAIIFWAVPSFRVRIIHLPSFGRPRWSLIALLAYGVSLASLILVPFFRQTPEIDNGIIKYPLDIPYFEALSHSVTVWGNTDSIVAAGRPLRYHWFTYAWSGWETQFSHAGPFVVLTRVLPLVSTVGIIFLTIALVQMLSRRSLAVALALTIGIFGTAIASLGNPGSEIVPISPSQLLTTVWLMAASVVFLRFVKAETDWTFSLVSFAILCIGCTGGKVMTSPVLGGAIAAVTVLLVIRNQHQFRAITALVTYFLATVIVYLLVVSDLNGLLITQMGSGVYLGSGMGVLFNPHLSPDQMRSYANGIPWVLIGIGGFVSLAAKTMGLAVAIRSPYKLFPEVVFAFGALFTGATLSVFLNQTGSSHLYFILSALNLATPIAAVILFDEIMVHSENSFRAKVLLLLLSLLGFITACVYYWARFEFLGFDVPSFFHVPDLTFWIWAPTVTLLAAFLIAIIVAVSIRIQPFKEKLIRNVLVFCAFLLTSLSISTGIVWHLGDQLRAFAEVRVDKSVEYSMGYGWTPAHVSALSWLKHNTADSDIFAVNRFCHINEYPPQCDSGSLVVSSLTGRRVLIEGYSWHSTISEKQKPTWLLNRIKASLSFSESPSEILWYDLRSYGVTWLVIDKKFPKAETWEPYGTIKFENKHIILIKLKISSAPVTARLSN